MTPSVDELPPRAAGRLPDVEPLPRPNLADRGWRPWPTRQTLRHDTPPGQPRRIGYLYILPALAAFVLFGLLPILHALYLSFFHWDGVTQATWAGLANYTAIAQDPHIRGAFEHTFVLIIFFSVIPITLGLIMSAALSRIRVRGLTAFRTILFLPQILPAVVVAVVWTMIYVPNGGPLNGFFRAVGVPFLAQDWLGSYTLALPAIGIIGTWVEFGLVVILFLAGIQQISPNLYDAARVDGAGAIREFFAVTLPGVRNQLVVATVLTLTDALRTFDLIYIVTRGGPGDSTTVPAYLVYQLAFEESKVGAAAAVGIVLSLLIVAISIGVIRFAESADEPAS